jgi:hypothetical protein
MLNSIHTLSDIETFFIYLIQEESLNFHPDENFKNYINIHTLLASYTTEEAEIRNELLDTCFEICEKEGADIYAIGLQFFLDRLK